MTGGIFSASAGREGCRPYGGMEQGTEWYRAGYDPGKQHGAEDREGAGGVYAAGTAGFLTGDDQAEAGQ